MIYITRALLLKVDAAVDTTRICLRTMIAKIYFIHDEVWQMSHLEKNI